ncbi:MAG: cyclomaltodextrinase N-terminal domain-containing protein [Bacteroidetes bacterium]|nr:cyclomaltodextrinase N-terminal domain-containing protein [Bacteroidota bacterium]
MKTTSLLFALLTATSLLANQPSVSRVEPLNWWVGMKWAPLQLLIHGKDLAGSEVTSSHPGLTVQKVHPADSPNYLFVDIGIADSLKPGTYQFKITKPGQKPVTIDYELWKRESPEKRYTGFNSEDVVYLITPDRFANGDPSNDQVEGLLEGVDRKDPFGRHGGDIQGIINNLDYMKELGVTAVWINPLVENRGKISYHGYAATDFYKIDPRYGTNDQYRQLVDEARKRDMKIIVDHVNNHIGIEHWWMNDLPFKDWIHGSKAGYLKPIHQKENLVDRYGDVQSRNVEQQGWFSPYMPDMNQRNPFMANYLIQNTIWWVEFAGLHGIREDTYPYAYLDYQSAWNQAMKREYPTLTIVGEVWIENPVYVSVFQGGNPLSPIDTHMESVTDFGFYGAAKRLVAYEKSPKPLYHALTQDFLYPEPNRLLTFLDNHDVERLMYQADKDVDKFLMALSVLFTVRGVPSIYYGTELGLYGGPDHGTIREDFPGGWKSDKRNAFSASGRTEQENRIFNYTQKLISLRKNHPALTKGKTVQYPPKGDLYWYLRESGNDRILVVVNTAFLSKELDLSMIKPDTAPFASLFDLMNGGEETLPGNMKIKIPGTSTRIYQLR